MKLAKRVAVLCAAVLVVLGVLPGSALAFNPEAMVDCDLWQKEGGAYRWAAQDINDAISFEVFLGYPTGTHSFEWLGRQWTRPTGPEFRPSGEITRAEFATALARVLRHEGWSGPVEGFSDVRAEDWFAPYVGALVFRRVVVPSEYGGELVPGAPITRAEIAAWVGRAALAEGVKDPGTQAAFLDVSPDYRYFREISVAAGLGIVRGYPDSTFKPDEKASRAEAAAMMMRLVRKLDKNPPKVEDLKPAVQEAFDAMTAFLKKYRGFPEDAPATFRRELGQWYTAPNLDWYVYPEMNKQVGRGLGNFLGGGEGIVSGFINLRIDDPRFWYGTNWVESVEPVWLCDRWAMVKVVWVHEPHTYDGAPHGQVRYETVFCLRLDGGRWKLCDLVEGRVLAKGFNLHKE
ncbi:MAG: S-layer homology domain-containing protein [Bacillota bacterium]